MATDWNNDEDLLADLGDAVRSGHDVPDRFVDIGRAAFTWQNVDAELAALTFDSTAASVAGPAPGTRAGQESLRSLTFTAPDMTIELEVQADALVGQVVPPAPGEIEVRRPDWPARTVPDGPAHTVPVDELGWFVVRPRPAGLFSLRIQMSTGAVVVTEWSSL